MEAEKNIQISDSQPWLLIRIPGKIFKILTPKPHARANKSKSQVGARCQNSLKLCTTWFQCMAYTAEHHFTAKYTRRKGNCKNVQSTRSPKNKDN